VAKAGNIYECETTIADNGKPVFKTIFAIKPTGKDKYFNSAISKTFLLGKAIEDRLKTDLKKQISPNTTLSVTCPKEMLAKTGAVYECTVKFGDETLKAKITTTSDAGAYKISVNSTK